MSEYYSEWYNNFKDLLEQLGEDELYDSFRSMLSHSRSSIALNHKLMTKAIEQSWVEAIETGLVYIDNVIRNPRKTIVNVEEVVPIALSKKITVDSVKHLAQHTDLIQSIDPTTGKITPSKVLNVHKEESLLTYENKFVNTLIDRLYIFVNSRYSKLKEASANEEVFAMEYNTAMDSGGGSRMKMSLKIETVDSLETTNENGSTMWERVEKIREIVESYKASQFCQQMGANYIRPPVMRTNAIMKNVDFKACLVLWQFIESYDKVGYEIDVSDTAQKPDQTYIENLYSLISMNFLLFRTFTQENDKPAEVLKTKQSRAASPRIVRKLERTDTEGYNLSFGIEEKPQDTEEQDTEKLPSDSDEILSQIDKIIEIETCHFKLEEEKRLEAEERERRRQEEIQRRIEEQRRLEEERLRAEEEAERLEKERLEKERLEKERLEQERLAKEEAERLEKERIEREKAEQEERERQEAEKAELGRMIGDEMEKLEAEKAAKKAEEEKKQREREQREAERAAKLKEMRTELERKSFEEIYAEYSKTPYHVIRREICRIISLIRKDGKVIREGDSDNPMLIERIAKEAEAKRQAQRDMEEAKQMQILYSKYCPTRRQRIKNFFKRKFGKKRKKVYVMPAQMPPKRTGREQRAYDKKMRAIFRKYHVSVFTKLIRKIKKDD